MRRLSAKSSSTSSFDSLFRSPSFFSSSAGLSIAFSSPSWALRFLFRASEFSCSSASAISSSSSQMASGRGFSRTSCILSLNLTLIRTSICGGFTRVSNTLYPFPSNPGPWSMPISLKRPSPPALTGSILSLFSRLSTSSIGKHSAPNVLQSSTFLSAPNHRRYGVWWNLWLFVGYTLTCSTACLMANSQ